jgi:periplasmic divalent cation tolerance protein
VTRPKSGPSGGADGGDASDVRIVVSTAPPDVAHGIAKALVSERLAACVNLLPGVRSVYRWKDAVQDDPETLLWIKTTEPRLGALSARLAALHPYEVPEVLVLAPLEGSTAYLDWVRASTGTVVEPGDSAPAQSLPEA